jgi:hypothetical protein
MVTNRFLLFLSVFWATFLGCSVLCFLVWSKYGLWLCRSSKKVQVVLYISGTVAGNRVFRVLQMVGSFVSVNVDM